MASCTCEAMLADHLLGKKHAKVRFIYVCISFDPTTVISDV